MYIYIYYINVFLSQTSNISFNKNLEKINWKIEWIIKGSFI